MVLKRTRLELYKDQHFIKDFFAFSVKDENGEMLDHDNINILRAKEDGLMKIYCK